MKNHQRQHQSLNLAKNKVLFINYYYPPHSYSATHRIAKFSQYLPDFGWRPVIMKPKVVIGNQVDFQLWDDVKDKVIMEPAISFASFFKKQITDPRQINGPQQTVAQKPTTNTKTPKKKKQSRIINFLNYFAEKLLKPDTQIIWAPFALIKGLIIQRKHQPKAIFASGPPFSIFVIATILKKLTGTPLVLSFHDPWTLNPYMNWNTRLNRFFEKWVIKNAAQCIFTTTDTTQMYAQKFPQFADKFTTIYNGFDHKAIKSKFENVPLEIDTNYFNVIYTGTITPFRTPDAFLDAVELAVKKKPELRRRLRVHFFGQFEHNLKQQILTKIDRLNLKEIIHLHGFLSHQACIAHLKAADALLFFTGNRPGGEKIVAGKTFEYMSMRKPIIAMTYPDGEASKIMKKSGLGQIIEHDDYKAATEALLNLYNQAQNPTIHQQLNLDYLYQFSRRNLTKQLARVLDEVAALKS